MNTTDTQLSAAEMINALKALNSNKDAKYTAVETDGELRIDVEGDVDISNNDTIERLPFRLGHVSGSFLCSKCSSLTSLEGAPQSVGFSFWCDDCKSLTSLEGAPQSVGSIFSCNATPITSLHGAPQSVSGDFWCDDCKSLTSLEGAPQSVGGGFRCEGSSITSLHGAPRSVKFFTCGGCMNLTSLEGAPQNVKGGFSCGYCPNLTSLQGAPKSVGEEFCCCGCFKLTSLQGAPEHVGDDFDCSYCTGLTSFDGAPKTITGRWVHWGCHIKKAKERGAKAEEAPAATEEKAADKKICFSSEFVSDCWFGETGVIFCEEKAGTSRKNAGSAYIEPEDLEDDYDIDYSTMTGEDVGIYVDSNGEVYDTDSDYPQAFVKWLEKQSQALTSDGCRVVKAANGTGQADALLDELKKAIAKSKKGTPALFCYTTFEEDAMQALLANGWLTDADPAKEKCVGLVCFKSTR